MIALPWGVTLGRGGLVLCLVEDLGPGMDEDDAGFARELRVETFARVEQKVRKLA